jgi:hypothetical protein
MEGLAQTDKNKNGCDTKKRKEFWKQLFTICIVEKNRNCGLILVSSKQLIKFKYLKINFQLHEECNLCRYDSE